MKSWTCPICEQMVESDDEWIEKRIQIHKDQHCLNKAELRNELQKVRSELRIHKKILQRVNNSVDQTTTTTIRRIESYVRGK